MPMLLKVAVCLFGGALLASSGCQKSAPPADTAAMSAQSAGDAWAKTRDGFIEDYLKAQPFFAAQAGRHEFDGQMPDLSADGIAHEIARLHAAHAQIAAVDAAALQPAQRFEREYALNVVDHDLFWLEKARQPFTNPYWYINAIDPDLYLSRNYAPLDQRLKAYITYARTIPNIAAEVAANLQSPLPKSFVDLAVDGFGGYADFYKNDVAAIFAAVKDPQLQRQLAEVDAAAAQAMTQLKNHFVAERKTANANFALGKDLFVAMLRETERVDLPIDQIEAAGRADLQRNLDALKAECGVYLPKRTIQACIAKMTADKPQGGAVAGARAQLIVLKNFVADNHIASIPSTEDALVAEAPPYNRGNFAFIQVPGPYDHGVASVYNIAPPDPKWSKAEQAAYIPGKAVLMFTSAHEVWPGHFLQFLHSNNNPTKLEGLWVGYAFAEGWAHYCEEMMIERGFGKGDPAMHIGQLSEALLRDVRLLSAIGLHTQGMTQAESEKMFREQAFQDPGNARQQAARGTYDPAYLNYTLGKLMIRKLRDDWVAKQLAANAPAAPGSAAPATAPTDADKQNLLRDFHDQFLSYGGPAIPQLRKEMLGEQGAVL
ncbi:MAG: DUF885 domain-containing protein [Steroidobacteraceae bacterium]|jgi:uncharacterized protein (DUF885 family)